MVPKVKYCSVSGFFHLKFDLKIPRLQPHSCLFLPGEGEQGRGCWEWWERVIASNYCWRPALTTSPGQLRARPRRMRTGRNEVGEGLGVQGASDGKRGKLKTLGLSPKSLCWEHHVSPEGKLENWVAIEFNR